MSGPTSPESDEDHVVAQRNLAAAASWVARLEAAGVRHVVVSPGSRSTPLVLAWARSGSARLEVALDERVAGFTALGAARTSGAPSVVVCTSGSALSHYFPAVMEAHASRIPLIVMSADRPHRLHDCGAPQTTRQPGLFGEHVRWSAEAGTPTSCPPGRIRALSVQAVAAACGPPAGPVHLNLKFPEPLVGEPPAVTPNPVAPVLVGRAGLSETQLASLGNQLCRGPGVVVCGPRAAGCDRLPAAWRFRSAVTRLAARLGWPILADPLSQVRWGCTNHGLIVAGYDLLLRHPDFAARQTPSRVLRFGRLPASKPLGRWLASHRSADTTLVDPGGSWEDPYHTGTRLIVADPAKLCEDLLEHLREPAPAAWIGRWQDAERLVGDAVSEVCQQPDWEGAVARRLVELLPERSLLHVASSMPIRDVEAFAPCQHKDLAVTGNRGVNGIDGTISTALGAASAWPHGPAAVLCGDLALLHDLGGLLELGRRRVALTVIVINNGGGGIFDFLPIASHDRTLYRQFFLTPHRADLRALAEAAGLVWHRTDGASTLACCLDRALSATGPSLIEVRIDRRLNVARHQQAWQRARQALARPTVAAGPGLFVARETP